MSLSLWNSVDPLFDDFLPLSSRRGGNSNSNSWLSNFHPMQGNQLQMRETKNGYDIEVDLPGIPKDRIKLSIDRNNMIEIDAKEEQKEENENEGVKSVKRTQRQFYRKFSLPKDACKDSLNADFVDGVLTMHLNKLGGGKDEKEDHKKYIDINASSSSSTKGVSSEAGKSTSSKASKN